MTRLITLPRELQALASEVTELRTEQRETHADILELQEDIARLTDQIHHLRSRAAFDEVLARFLEENPEVNFSTDDVSELWGMFRLEAQ